MPLLDTKAIMDKQMEMMDRCLDLTDRLPDNDGEWRNHPVKGDHSINAGGGSFRGQTRSTDKGGFESMGEHLQCVMRAGMPSGQADPRLYEVRASGLSEGVGSEGGFLLPTSFSDQLLRLAHETGLLPSLCLKIPITKGNSINLPTIDQTSRADGSRLGGITALWESEAALKTASKPKFRNLNLQLKKLIGLCWATDELVEDAALLETVIREGFKEEFGFKLDDAIINGTGAGMPLGVLASPCLVTARKEVGQASATIVYENILALWARMPGRNRKKAIWAINQDIEPSLYTMGLMIGFGGSPVYLPPSGASEQPYGSLFGRPVIPLEQCQTLGTAGDIILGDFSTYCLADKGGLQSAVSVHVRFVYDEQVFRFVLRQDGQPLWNSPLTPYKGSNEQSPFVVLEDR